MYITCYHACIRYHKITYHPTLTQELKDAFIKDGMPLTLPTNDLRKTKGMFVKLAMENMDKQDGEFGSLLTKKEKYLKAVQMWMDSSIRSVLSAGKQPGFALATTNGD